MSYLNPFLKKAIPPFLESLRRYTRLETEGIENIPKRGSVIIVANHSGVWGWDAFILQNEIFQKASRIPRTMSHNFWHKNELLATILQKLAYIPQDFKKAVRVLKKNNLLLLFPEAEEGNFKPSTKMYQLQDFNPGFIALAALSKARIVPCCIIGAEETHINLGTIDWTEKYIGAKIPLPLNLIPFPAQWKIIFLKPLSLEKYAKQDFRQEKFLVEAAANIQMRIQRKINQELIQRKIFQFVMDG